MARRRYKKRKSYRIRKKGGRTHIFFEMIWVIAVAIAYYQYTDGDIFAPLKDLIQTHNHISYPLFYGLGGFAILFIIFAIYSTIQTFAAIRKYNTELAIKMSFTHYRMGCIDNMNPFSFEELAIQLLIHDGYESGINTQASNDKGIDAWVKRKKKKKLFGFIPSADKIPVQMKRYSNKVQPKEIREFAGAMQHAGCDEGIFFTNNLFSSGCKEYFKSYNIKKYDRTDIKRIVRKIPTKEFIKLYLQYIKKDY